MNGSPDEKAERKKRTSPVEKEPPGVRGGTRRAARVTNCHRSISPRMNFSTASRASSSLYCTGGDFMRSEEHTSELQSRENLVCRLLLEKKKKQQPHASHG